MKRFIQAACLVLMILIFAGCGQGGNGARKMGNKNSVEKAISEQIAAAETEQSNTAAGDSNTTAEPIETENFDTAPEQAEASAPMNEPDTAQPDDSTKSGDVETVDYNLTAMNSDMVYATVYQMMIDPESYIGKTVKMRGSFYPCTNADGTGFYAACIVEDALACCAQGIEFVWDDGSHTYPDEYPEPGSIITVKGIFKTYYDGDYLYCHLTDATLDIGN